MNDRRERVRDIRASGDDDDDDDDDEISHKLAVIPTLYQVKVYIILFTQPLRSGRI